MKSFEVIGIVTQNNMENIKTNKVEKFFDLYINAYKTNQLNI